MEALSLAVAAKQGISRKTGVHEKDLWGAVRNGTSADVDAALLALKRNSSNVDARNSFGSTALHIAVWRNHVPIVRRLLAAGADFDVRDGESGWSSLHRALHFGHLAVAGVLIEAGANLSLEDSKGRTPVDLISNPVRQIMGALNNAGGAEVFSWGNGSNYQLGTGTAGIHKLPCRLDALQGQNITATAAAKFHSLAITADGSLYSWGFGRGGRLGHFDFDIHSGQVAVITPRLVLSGLGSRRVRVIAAAKHHTMVATEGGEVFTWGSNREGQLGYTSVDTQPTPRRVTALKSRVVAVAAANKHSAVLTDAGEIFTWGCNREGQLGYGTSNSASNPIPRVVEYLKGKSFCAASAAKYHTVVLGAEGEVFTWGYKMVMPKRVLVARNTRKLGSAPLKFHQAERLHVVAIAAGLTHSTALSEDGHIFYWVSSDPHLRCHQILSMANHQAVSIAAGKYRIAVVTACGNVYAWDGEKTKVDMPPSPFRIHGIKHATHISVGENHSLVVASVYTPKFPPEAAVDSCPRTSTLSKDLEDFEEEIDFGDMLSETSTILTCPEVTKKSTCEPPTLKDLCQKVMAQCVVEPKNALQLLEISDSLGAQELRKHCEDLVLHNLDYLLTISPMAFGHVTPTLLADIEKALDKNSSQPWSSRLLPTPTAAFPAIVESEEENEMGHISRRRALSFSEVKDVSSGMKRASEGLFHQESEGDVAAAKHVRALRKKLQQIEALELKQARGYALDHQQEEKIQTKQATIDAILAMSSSGALIVANAEQLKDELFLQLPAEKSQGKEGIPQKVHNARKKANNPGDQPSYDNKREKSRRPNKKEQILCVDLPGKTADVTLSSALEKEVKLCEGGQEKSTNYSQVCGFSFSPEKTDKVTDLVKTINQLETHSLVAPLSKSLSILAAAESSQQKKKNKKGGLSMFLSGALDELPKPPAPIPAVLKVEGPAWGGAQKNKGLESLREIQSQQTVEANSCAFVEDTVHFSKFVKAKQMDGDSNKGPKSQTEVLEFTDMDSADGIASRIPLSQFIRTSAPIAVTPAKPSKGVASGERTHQHDGSPTPWVGTSPLTPSSFKEIQMEQVKHKVQQKHGGTHGSPKPSIALGSMGSSTAASLVERAVVEPERTTSRWYKPDTRSPSSIRCIQIEEAAINELRRMYKNAKVVRSGRD